MENDLIRRSDVERWILTESACIDTPADRDAVVERMRYSIPAVDAVEVVRCGDCVHLNRVHMNISGNYRCDRYAEWQDESNRVHMPWTGFCSYGQRREDGDA